MICAPFHFTTHPARARPIAALCTLAAIVAMGVLVTQIAGDWLWGSLATLALFLSLARFFLPTRYRIDESGCEVVYPLSKSRLLWSDVGLIRWTAVRALIARSAARRERHRALDVDLSQLEADRATQLRTFVAARTSAEAWQ